MNYTILIYETPADFAVRTDPDKQQAYWAAWPPYSKALKDAGVFVSGAGLQPPETATTLRFRDQQRLVQDGPFNRKEKSHVSLQREGTCRSLSRM